ncbi:MAG: hypothetical protein M1415_11520 [Firmicutes bacterium]|nr:hypothetical protein [Bacillota bacterium]
MTLLDLAVFLLWSTAVLMAMVKTNRSVNLLFRIQALGEATVAAVLAVTLPYSWLWLTVAAVLIIKVLIVPRLLFHNDPLVQGDYGARSPFGTTALLFFFLLATVFALVLVHWMKIGHPTLVGVLLAALLVSLIHMSSRYEAWSIARALLGLETICGAGILVIGLTLEEPADLAVDIVALFLALTISWAASTLMRLKHTVDVREIKELIG